MSTPPARPGSFAELAALDGRLGKLLADVRTFRITKPEALATLPALVGPRRRERGDPALFTVDALLECKLMIFDGRGQYSPVATSKSTKR